MAWNLDDIDTQLELALATGTFDKECLLYFASPFYGEGCISISLPGGGLQLHISSKTLKLLHWINETFGGRITGEIDSKRQTLRKHKLWIWQISGPRSLGHQSGE